MTPSTRLGAALLAVAAPLFPEFRQAPPGDFVPPQPPLPPASSRQRWWSQRSVLQAKWTGILGPFPQPLSLPAEELERTEAPDHTRVRLRYPVEPGTVAEAYLLLPKGQLPGRRPGMVILHATSATHMGDPAGLSGRETMHLALHLVRRGYVCIAPRNYLWETAGRGYQQAAEAVLARPPWRTGMARMVWDAIRATDVLVARREVDGHRVGTMGHSLGGKEALYHAAFDPRIRAAVSCEGGIGRTFSNWEADWYLGKQIQKSDFNADHHEVLALIAPRAFLLIGGESADGARSWPFVDACRPLWKLFGAEDRLGLMRHRFGHDFPPPGPERDRVWAWLDAMLAPTPG